MAADVFGQRVHHDVCTVFERPAQERRCHGVVDNQRDAMFVGDIGPALDIHHVTGRVANGFAEQGAGVVINRFLHCLKVVVTHHTAVDTLVWQRVGKQVVGAAIELAGTDNVVAHFADGLQGVKDGRHTRGHREGTHTTFKLRHTLLQYGIGGVHDARIDVALYLQVKQVRTVLSVVERVGRSLIDGRGCGVGRWVAVEASVKGEGFRFHG